MGKEPIIEFFYSDDIKISIRITFKKCLLS